MMNKNITPHLTLLLLLFLFVACKAAWAKEYANCDITNLTVADIDCEADGSYTLCLDLIGQALPTQDDDLKLVINSQTIHHSIDYQLTSIDGSTARICVNLENESRSNLDVFVKVEDGCTYYANNLYNEPDCSNPTACTISSISNRTPACLWYDVYEVIFDVAGENLPESEAGINVMIDGMSYEVTQYNRDPSGESAELSVTVQQDNNQDVDVTIELESGCSFSVANMYDEPDCGDEPVCSITAVTNRTPACLWYDVYEVIFDVVGENLPTSDNDVVVRIDGQSYQVTRYERDPSGNSAEVRVTVLRDNAQDVDVEIELADGCSYSIQDMYDEPDCGDEPVCNITGVTNRTPACLWYDVYEVIFDVVGENLPTSDNDVVVKIDGQSYQVTRYERDPSGNSAEVRVTVLRDNAQDVDVEIELADGCSYSIQDMYDEPDCGDEPVCNITSVTNRTPACLWYDVYEVIFDVVGENLPTSDNDVVVRIDGESYQVTRYERDPSGNSAEVRVTVLRDNAQDVDVEIELADGCSYSVQDMYDEPDCGDEPECSITGVTNQTPSCLYYDVYEVIFDVVGENLPTSDNDIEVRIDGQSYQVTRYERDPSGNSAEVWVTVLRDNAQDVDVEISLVDGCSYSVQDMYDEPDCGDPPPCTITSVTNQTPSCLYYDVYEVIFDVVGENLPASDNDVEVRIDGQSYQVTRYIRAASGNAAEVWVTVTRDNAQDVDVEISLEDGCNYSIQDMYDEPDCGDPPGCSISSVTNQSPSCLSADVYEVIFDIVGNDLPASATDIAVMVDGIPAAISQYLQDASGDAAELTVIVQQDNNQNVDVYIELESGCSISLQDMYDEPNCGDLPPCDITSMEVASVSCMGNGNYDLCIELTGQGFPAGASDMKVVVDHQPYPIISYNYDNIAGTATICVSGIEGDGDEDIEAFVRMESGCTYTAQNFMDEPNCGTARIGRTSIENFKLYPNPNRGSFTIEVPDMGTTQLSIHNLIGQQLFVKTIQGNTVESLHMPQLDAGVYIVRLNNGHNVESKRLIIE